MKVSYKGVQILGINFKKKKNNKFAQFMPVITTSHIHLTHDVTVFFTVYKLRNGSFFKFRNSKKVQSDEEHISIIMNRKNPANTKYATWVVSNCESTSGASQRFQYAQRLVSATDFTIKYN